MDADGPAVVPPEEAVPPGVVLQSFLDEPGGVRAWLSSLTASVRRLLRRRRP